MKFNLLYLLIFIALAACYWIVHDLSNQGDHIFFGAAEAEGRIVNVDFAALVQRVYTRPGMEVHKGDTLALLFRAELDRKTQEYLVEIRQLETEHQAKAALLQKDRDLLHTKQTAHTAALESEIKLLEAEADIQSNLKNLVGTATQNNGAAGQANLKAQQMAALRQSIHQSELQTEEQLSQINTQLKTSREITANKIAQIQQNIDFLNAEKPRLALLSPIDGYVEQVNAAANEMVQQYRELFKVNPQRPNKVIGFIHESTQIPFRIGDSVELASVSRITVPCKARISGVSPKMVELPFRLRKFTEVRTWGREVFINLPEDNPFFIGEKIRAKI